MRISFLVAAFLALLVTVAVASEIEDNCLNSTNHLIEFIDALQQQVVNFTGVARIPFRYPERPTITASIGGQKFELLLDSGTRLSVLKLDANEKPPIGLHFVGSDSALADLDGSRQLEYPDHSLKYAEAALLSSGELRIRRLPFRIYSYADGRPPSDFAGSLSVSALRDFVVGIDNDAQEVCIQEPGSYQPARTAAAIPMLQLHDMLLVKAQAGQGELLLMLDTGYSGEILLSDEATRKQDQALTYTGKLSAQYSGFHGEIQGNEFLLDDLKFTSQPWPGLASGTISQGMLAGVAIEAELERTALGQLDGILGAGFLSRFNYAIDQSRGVLFLQER
ncbi:MAG: hypothetical protein H7A35_12465 [Planctomycetales bacterium]|nr:hypothetical protein [bacterium]UNM07665.1 MAG: hypothetical protein H7A35_12465 [Planctomycetales bacterium]